MRKELPTEDHSYTLQGWLVEVYFDNDKHADFTQGDIEKVGDLVARMLKFVPWLRATASETLSDACFEQSMNCGRWQRI